MVITSSLVSGPISESNWPSFVKRVRRVNSKAGPFCCVLVAGRCEPDASVAPPVPVYFSDPQLDPGDISPEIHCVGSYSLMDLGGLRIALCSSSDSLHHLVSQRSSRDAALGIDFLVLHEMPAGLLTQVPRALLPASLRDSELSAESLLLQVQQGNDGRDAWAAALDSLGPRYTLCPANEYWERPPFRFRAPFSHTGRFLSLASVGNPGKQKWLYAVSVARVTLQSDHTVVPDATPFPCTIGAPPKSAVAAASEPGEGYQRFQTSSSKPQKKRRRRADPKLEALARRGAGSCWFCLASPKVERHLVASVAQEVYVAMAKGGMMEGHALILPIVHLSAMVDLPPTALCEVERYKEAMRAMAATRGNVMIFSERNIPTKYGSPHAHIQAMEVAKNLVGKVRQVMFQKSEEMQVKWTKIVLVNQVVPYHNIRDKVEGYNYIWVEFPDGELYYTVEPESLNLQFTRHIVAFATGVPRKTDWKQCVVPEEKEIIIQQQWMKQLKELNLPPF